MFFITIHANHFVGVLPVVAFFLVVAFVTAVVLVAAWWNHPVSYICKVLTFVRDIDLPLSHHSDLFYKLYGVGKFAYEFKLEI